MTKSQICWHILIFVDEDLNLSDLDLSDDDPIGDPLVIWPKDIVCGVDLSICSACDIYLSLKEHEYLK